MRKCVLSDYDYQNTFNLDKFLKCDNYFSFRFGVVLIELYFYRKSYFTIRTCNFKLSPFTLITDIYANNFVKSDDLDSLFNRVKHTRFSGGYQYYAKFKKSEFLFAVKFYHWFVNQFLLTFKVDDDFYAYIGDCDYDSLFADVDKLIKDDIVNHFNAIGIVKPKTVDLSQKVLIF